MDFICKNISSNVLPHLLFYGNTNKDFILSSDWLSASSVPPTNVAKSRIVLHFFLVFN